MVGHIYVLIDEFVERIFVNLVELMISKLGNLRSKLTKVHATHMDIQTPDDLIYNTYLSPSG